MDHYHLAISNNRNGPIEVQGTKVFYKYADVLEAYREQAKMTEGVGYCSCYDFRCPRYFEMFQEYEMEGWRSYLANKDNLDISTEVEKILVEWQESHEDSGETFTSWAQQNLRDEIRIEWRHHMYRAGISFEDWALSFGEHYFKSSNKGLLCACGARQLHACGVGVDISGIWHPLDDEFQNGCLGADPVIAELAFHPTSLVTAAVALSDFISQTTLGTKSVINPFAGWELLDSGRAPSIGTSIYVLNRRTEGERLSEYLAFTQIGREEQFQTEDVGEPMHSLVQLFGNQMIKAAKRTEHVEVKWYEGFPNIVSVKVTDVDHSNREIEFQVGLSVMSAPRKFID